MLSENGDSGDGGGQNTAAASALILMTWTAGADSWCSPMWLELPGQTAFRGRARSKVYYSGVNWSFLIFLCVIPSPIILANFSGWKQEKQQWGYHFQWWLVFKAPSFVHSGFVVPFGAAIGRDVKLKVIDECCLVFWLSTKSKTSFLRSVFSAFLWHFLARYLENQVPKFRGINSQF